MAASRVEVSTPHRQRAPSSGVVGRLIRTSLAPPRQAVLAPAVLIEHGLGFPLGAPDAKPLPDTSYDAMALLISTVFPRGFGVFLVVLAVVVAAALPAPKPEPVFGSVLLVELALILELLTFAALLHFVFLSFRFHAQFQKCGATTRVTELQDRVLLTTADLHSKGGRDLMRRL